MDGTKPAMESNAEETQDEGQESKGTLNPQLAFARFWHFFPPVFGDICVCASASGFNLFAMAFSLARDTIAWLFLFCGLTPI